MLQRTVTSARAVLPRRVIASSNIRTYTEYGTGRGSQSKGFSQKEKAQEDQYVYEQEKAKLKKLQEEIEAHKVELAQLQEAKAKVEKK